MGICLHNKDFEMDMGYGSFFNLRCVIAELLDSNFGENYSNLSRCYSKADFDTNDSIAQYWIETKQLDKDIIDFLYQSDSEGKVYPKTCRKIYNLVKNYDTDHTYGYDQSNRSFSYFKEMIHDCAVNRRVLFWN